MIFLSSFIIAEKVKSLSEKLKHLTQDSNSYRTYVDTSIKSENLRLNLSLTISQIILSLRLATRSKDEFNEIISEYNKLNKTSLHFEDFEKLAWVRIVVGGQVVIPELVRHFVWKVGYDEEQGKTLEIPPDKVDLVRCLQIYQRRFFENARLTLSKSDLNSVLQNHALPIVTIDFLIERKVIEASSENNEVYYWTGGEYARHLRNEIASTLWLLIGGEDANEKEFEKYFRLIKATGIRPDAVSSFLPFKAATRIGELAFTFLNAENDLLVSDNEFKKIWLDSYSYNHIDLNSRIPEVEFDFQNTFEFIGSVSYLKWRFPDIFDYQKTRSYCHTLLSLIIENDRKNYENVLTILKDTAKPFLIWILYHDIKALYPKVIPYLLTNPELTPLAFKLIDQIEINNSILSEPSNNDKRVEEIWEIKNQIWLEMFDVLLEQLASIRADEAVSAELVSKILLDVSEKVFDRGSVHGNRSLVHGLLRKRYDEVLAKLTEKRTDTTTYTSSLIRPRLVLSLLPSIVKYLKKRHQNQRPNHTEFLNLDVGFVDLCIEVLRFTHLRIAETEISQHQKRNIESAYGELVSLLEAHLVKFHTVEEVDVQLYDLPGTEKRKAKRGVNEFGFEIIDWGYLFLHFEKHGVLKKVNAHFTKSLYFNITESKYHDQNKEQAEKLRLYLKSLLIAHNSIKQKKQSFDIERLPSKATLDILESIIKELSTTHSVDKPSEKRIDVFDERFSHFNYHLYYQPLTSLLYHCVNSFKHDSQIKFVKEFFAESKDIGRMLTAINILDNEKIKNIISERITNISMDDFIQSVLTTNELQSALIEATNSESHWQLAEPLLQRIQDHFEKRNLNDDNISNLIFEIKLLLAFKANDFDKLITLPVPKNLHNNRNNIRGKNTKSFYTALFKIYNDKQYDEGILLLISLLSIEPKSILYAFHLYRAQTLKALETI